MRKFILKPIEDRHTERMEIRMKKCEVEAVDTWAMEKMCSRGEAVRRLITLGLWKDRGMP